MKIISAFKPTRVPRPCTLDVELLATIEACVRAIQSRDEAELHCHLAIREQLMNTLRKLLLDDNLTFSNLKMLREAARVESEMIEGMRVWRDEIGAQLANLDDRKRLVEAYNGDD